MPGVAIITEACIKRRVHVVHRLLPADVCPVGAIYSEEHVPDGSAKHAYNSTDANKGHDHTFFIQHNGAVFAD